jgi:hypothetical protein
MIAPLLLSALASHADDAGQAASILAENARLRTELASLQSQLKTCKSSVVEAVVQQAGTDDDDSRSARQRVLQKVQQPYFCPPSVSDNKKWRKKRGTLPLAPLGGGDRGNYQIPKPPQWFCDKLKSSLRPWEIPKKTTVHDLAVGIFAGEQLFYGQVIAQRDTWLSRVPASFIFAPTGDPRIPVIGLEKYGLQPDSKDRYVTQLVNLYAMKELYERAPDKKWYFIYGCDNYINVDYILLLLDNYDPEKPWWLTMYGVNERMPDWVKISKHPKAASKNSYQWAPGSFSWIVSNEVMKAFAENIESFLDDLDYDFKRTGVNKLCYCPDKVAGEWAPSATLGPDPYNG